MTQQKTVDVEQLLPCPFCGGEPQIKGRGGDERVAYAETTSVTCQECKATIAYADDIPKRGGYAASGTGRAKTITAWNTRPQGNAADSLAEAIKAARAIQHQHESHCDNIGQCLEPDDQADFDHWKAVLDSLEGTLTTYRSRNDG